MKQNQEIKDSTFRDYLKNSIGGLLCLLVWGIGFYLVMEMKQPVGILVALLSLLWVVPNILKEDNLTNKKKAELPVIEVKIEHELLENLSDPELEKELKNKIKFVESESCENN